jgi:hypothetical protein
MLKSASAIGQCPMKFQAPEVETLQMSHKTQNGDDNKKKTF